MKPNAKTLCVFSILSFAFSVLSFIFTAPDAIAFAFAFFGAVLLLCAWAKLNLLQSRLFILITAFIFITICSKSSPLYPFNDWVDANCFFTVGKSIVNGKTLYLDIFEQKGPLLYFLYAVAYKISPTTFFGVYLLEIASSFAFLLICYKTMLLFCSKKVIFALPVLSTIIYCAPAFSHGGSAEEFSLPIIALVLYIGLKSLISNKRISFIQWMIIGVSASVVLWIKFTFLGFFIGFLLFFFIVSIMKKEAQRFFLSMLWFVCGMVILSIPVLLYFIYNGAISALFSVYFYGNMFLYPKETSIGPNLGIGLFSVLKNFPAIFALIICGSIYLFKKERRIFYFFLLTAVSTFLFVYAGGRKFAYYSFILSVFIPLGTVFAYEKLKRLTNRLRQRKCSKTILTFSLFAVCITLSFLTSLNTSLLKYSKEEMPQFIFNETISQTENPTLLNYGFLDGGFYTVSNIVPNCKYFCGLNIPYDEIEKTQNHYVEKGLVDFVVTRDEKLPEEISSRYKIVSTADFKFEKKHFTYYLYKKVD